METKNIEPTIRCNGCSNIPLIGVEFINKCNKISDIIKIHSYCIFNHDKKNNETFELMINDIFNNKKMKKKCIEIKCNNCAQNKIEYLCLECKRNICKECIKFHRTHNKYINKNYLSLLCFFHIVSFILAQKTWKGY